MRGTCAKRCRSRVSSSARPIARHHLRELVNWSWPVVVRFYAKTPIQIQPCGKRTFLLDPGMPLSLRTSSSSTLALVLSSAARVAPADLALQVPRYRVHVDRTGQSETRGSRPSGGRTTVSALITQVRRFQRLRPGAQSEGPVMAASCSSRCSSHTRHRLAVLSVVPWRELDDIEADSAKASGCRPDIASRHPRYTITSTDVSHRYSRGIRVVQLA